MHVVKEATNLKNCLLQSIDGVLFEIGCLLLILGSIFFKCCLLKFFWGTLKVKRICSFMTITNRTQCHSETCNKMPKSRWWRCFQRWFKLCSFCLCLGLYYLCLLDLLGPSCHNLHYGTSRSLHLPSSMGFVSYLWLDHTQRSASSCIYI